MNNDKVSLRQAFADFFDRVAHKKNKAMIHLLGSHDDLAKRQKMGRYVRYTLVSLAIAIMIAGFFVGTPGPSSGSHFDVPALNAGTEKRFSFPDARDSNGDLLALKLDKKSDEKKKQARVTYPGPQVILRNFDGKIPDGTEVKAKLISGATNGRVKAVITENISIRGDILMESGTILIGDGSSTEERLNIQFKKAVFRDGSTAAIEAQAFDLSDSILGLKGSKLNSQAGRLAASIGLNFVGGMSLGLTSSDFQNGQLPPGERAKNALLTGTSAAAMEEGQNMMNESKSKAIVIEVPKDTEFFVAFSGN